MKTYFRQAKIVFAVTGGLLLWFSDQTVNWQIHMSLAGIVFLMIGLYLMQSNNSCDKRDDYE